ncbi:hypothetical protein NCC49_001219 [Naganishia albida]|nr:hypothetical protein NCC49_001219 [Naganishia albida]
MTIPVRNAETEDFFFFGTLMVPQILTRVLGHKGEGLTFQDAILPGYVRHCVKGADYPGILHVDDSRRLLQREVTTEESIVRGTFVRGLSLADVHALDVFEGDEYTRASLPILTLSPSAALSELSIDFTTPTARSAVSHEEAERKVHEGEEGCAEVKGWCYTWKDTTEVGLTGLEPAVWDFQAFLIDKSHRWTGLPPPSATFFEGRDEAEYAEVDRYRALGGRTFPDQLDPSPVHTKDGETEQGLPEFGKGLLQYWKFDPDYINLNHGSYGSPPIPVINAMRAISDECERCPDLFMRRTYLPLMDKVRKRLAGMVGADVEDCVLVGNATVGVNTVVWNIDWKKGDVIVAYSTTYGAVKQTLKYICDKHEGVECVEIPLNFPETHDQIVQKTENVLKKYGPGSEQRVRMVVIDSIASNPGVIMPWERIVQLCKEYDALSLVDAAHHLGQLPVDLSKVQPDFWVSNCHKWLMSHRGCALFYVAKNRQPLIRSSLPTSHLYESEKYPATGQWVFAKQWEWVGTQDWAPVLSIPAALDFRDFLGGEERITEYCHNLAVAGGRKAAEILGTAVVETDKGELTANMVNVRLPALSASSDNSTENKEELLRQYEFLLDQMFKAKVFAAVYWHNGSWMARFSAQVWNELDDYPAVATVLRDACVRARSGAHAG